MVNQFSEGGATNDVRLLEPVLAPSFRIVFNDTHSKEVKVIDRTTYLQLINNKTFGGEKREVQIESLQVVNDLTAAAKLIQSGESNVFHSFMNLVYHQDQWQIASETIFVATH